MRPKTILCDIDGTIFRHHGSGLTGQLVNVEMLQGAKEKFMEWDSKGYNIILLTGRRESMRVITERQLTESGLYYDQLIMGLGGGQRCLINDLKTGESQPTAISINIKRNEGLKDVQL